MAESNFFKFNKNKDQKFELGILNGKYKEIKNHP